MLQHTQGQAFAEATGTDEEEEAVRLFYQRDIRSLVHIIIIVETDVLEVHHAVGESLPVWYYIFHNSSF